VASLNIILSIRPKYARLILSGAKRYEFRKSIFNNKHVEEAYIYETSPIKKIVGIFKIGDIIRASPQDLWDQLGPLSGMNKAEFFDYFQDIKIGFAIEIKNVEIFDVPFDPKEQIPGFNPPQSFCYSGLTSHDRRSVERSLPTDRPALRESQPSPSGSPG